MSLLWQDASETIGTSSTQVLPHDSARVCMLLQNVSRTATMGINLTGGTAQLFTQGSVMLPPLGSMVIDTVVGQNAITGVSSAAAQSLTAYFVDGAPPQLYNWQDASTAVGVSSTIVLAANPLRKTLLLHNPSESSVVAVNLTGQPAGMGAPGSVILQPFATILLDNNVGQNAVAAIGSDISCPLTINYI